MPLLPELGIGWGSHTYNDLAPLGLSRVGTRPTAPRAQRANHAKRCAATSRRGRRGALSQGRRRGVASLPGSRFRSTFQGFCRSQSAGPQALKLMARGRLKTLLDSPRNIWYTSQSDENGEYGQPKL